MMSASSTGETLAFLSAFSPWPFHTSASGQIAGINCKLFNLSVDFKQYFTNIFIFYRNRSKKSALKPEHFALTLCRTVLDSVGRLLLLFTLLHILKGNFDPLLVTISYYTIFILLLFFNLLFNKSAVSCEADFFLGKLSTGNVTNISAFGQLPYF